MLQRLQLYRTDRWLPILFFTVLLLIGIFIHRDYGLSWDDPIQHKLGLDTWNYILGNNDELFQNYNCYINPFVALLEVLPEKVLQPKSERAMDMSRHLVNYVFCWGGLIFFYLLALKLFRDYRYALISCLMLVLTPRLFAHCFYNSKDLPFLFLFVVTTYLLVHWINNPSWSKMAWLIIASGILIATRVAGVLFPVILLVAIGLELFSGNVKRKEIKMILTYFFLLPVSVYIFFPSIWQHPVQKFLDALVLYSHHPYDVTTFFMGETIHSLQTPWYYLPVWMMITIPMVWWIFFLIGLVIVIRNFFREKLHASTSWVIIVCWLFFPLGTAIILHTNTYEDGRHFFFVYPALLLIATAGFKWMIQFVSERKKFQLAVRTLAAILISYSTIAVTVFMIRFHPYQYTYFNEVGRFYAADYFDKDYWGLSFRNALEFLTKYDRSPKLNLRWNIDPCEWNLSWLGTDDRQRINVTSFNDCDYYITNYRSHHPEDASDQKIYEIRVQGFLVTAIYKMHPPNK